MIIRVSIVEDDRAYRDALATLLNGSPGFICTGAHSTTEQVIKALPSEKPNVLLLDLELAETPGDVLISEVSLRWPKIEILVLTIHDEPRRILEALEDGASGYLVKPVAPARLLEAVSDVSAGGSPMSSSIARLVIETFQERAHQRKNLAQLTAREEVILALLAQGYRYEEIAQKLGISVLTVGTHLHHIYEKLHVRSRAEAAAQYLQR